MLWWFEGATSYYDWRSVRLAKLCTAAEYLHHLAEEIARLRGHARRRRSPARRGLLRCLDQSLPPRRKHAQQHRQLLSERRNRLRASRHRASPSHAAARSRSTTSYATSIGPTAQKASPVPEDALPAIVEKSPESRSTTASPNGSRGHQPLPIADVARQGRPRARTKPRAATPPRHRSAFASSSNPAAPS